MTNEELVEKLRDKESRTEEDIELAAARIERQNIFLRHNLFAEKHFGVFFICGYAGEMDSNNMPESIHVCPAYGSDVTYRYTRGISSAPEW
jgi:hypothetical protein